MQRRLQYALISIPAVILCIALLASSISSRSSSNPGVGSFGTDTEKASMHKYGFNLDSFDVESFVLERDQFLGTILSDRGVPYDVIDALAKASEEVFSVRRLQPGKHCAIVRPAGSGHVDCFVYEVSPYRYVKYYLKDIPRAEMCEREVVSCVEVSGGEIHGSLWMTMMELGHHYDLIVRMENALAWDVDFHHIQNGDKYRLIYEYDYIDGVPVGVGMLLGAMFETSDRTTYSIYFESGNYNGYFDLEGRPMERAFLRAPVRYSDIRISSRYNPRRFHPVLKRYKGHYGTDYAAPSGTPIIAVADGTISRIGYTNGNGNFIKIRHDNTYETQYLHMRGFAKSMAKGVRVEQGQVIGYVGQTGLATGPHVCFRFWKNGRQVDHLRENLPPPDPMPADKLPLYFATRDALVPLLDAIELDGARASADFALR